MRYINYLHPARPAARRPIAAVSIVLYLATWIGLPLPVDLLAETIVSEPFPCQGHHCGCRSAEECWRHCCCFSMAERLAWAKANGVVPPAWVRATLPPEPAKLAGPRHCCSHCGQPYTMGPSDFTAALISASKNKATVVAAPRATPQKSHGDRWICVITAQHCRGASVDWIASGAVLLPPTILNLRPDATIGAAPGIAALAACLVPRLPPVPPPRA